MLAYSIIPLGSLAYLMNSLFYSSHRVSGSYFGLFLAVVVRLAWLFSGIAGWLAGCFSGTARARERPRTLGRWKSRLEVVRLADRGAGMIGSLTGLGLRIEFSVEFIRKNDHWFDYSSQELWFPKSRLAGMVTLV